MSAHHYLFSNTALTAQIAQGDSGSGGVPSLIVIAVIVLAVIWILSFLGGSEPVVVVVQRTPGAFLGWLLLAVTVVIVFFLYIAPASGTS